MRLHHNRESFLDLIAVTAPFIGIPETAVKRDYYIVLMLKNLQTACSQRGAFLKAAPL
jgi:hypothetical protein